MRLLTLHIQEPLPGRVLQEMAAEVGEEEALRRYRAIVLTTLRQLKGLNDTRLRIIADPEDADEALRFWLLPLLAEQWQHHDDVFRTHGWEIEFLKSPEKPEIESFLNILCPFSGARWVHTAMLGLERGNHRVIGRNSDGEEYFRAHTTDTKQSLETRFLPELPLISRDTHWRQALQSPLATTLKRSLEDCA